jgi:glucosamine-phosphate N-acetyltransferase
MIEFEYNTLLHLYQEYDKIMGILEDIKKQYLQLLSFLTDSPTISTSDFIERIIEISNMGDIVVCFYRDITTDKIVIVGSGTVIYEPKIIHGCGKVGHIEDIVVHSDYRSNGIAKNILRNLIDISKQHNCYKVILDCKEELVDFYQKNGFEYRGCQMAKYF